MDILFQWIKNIAYFLIFSSLLYQLLPDGRYRKYLQFAAGMILVILVASPLGQIFGWEEQLVEAADRFSWEIQQTELEQKIRMAEEAMQGQLQGEYEALIEGQVAELSEAYGYQVISCEVQLELDETSDDFGQVYSLEVVLAPETSDAMIWIEPVQVGEETAEAASAWLPGIRRELLNRYELSEEALKVQLMEPISMDGE